MKILYTIGIYLFQFVLLLISPFNKKVRKGNRGRAHSFQELKSIENTEGIIWMHCASLGEYEQGLPVYNALKIEYPKKKFIISFFSPSGYEVAKKKSDDFMFYLPMDTPYKMKRLVKMLKPEMVIFVKYEFWFNLLYELEQTKTPHILISGVLRSNQIFFKAYGSWFLERLKNFTFLFLQNQNSLNLVSDKNLTNATVSGDTRFNKVIENAENPEEIPFIKDFLQDKACIMAGSTWPQDHALFLQYCKEKLSARSKLVIAPHEVQKFQIDKLQNQLQNAIFENPNFPDGKVLLWSDIQKFSNNLSPFSILIIDTIGILSQLYHYADVCYVGGAFRKKRGLHNILEPAAFGKAIFFGPYYQDFPEAIEMIAQEAATSVSDYPSFQITLQNYLQDKNYRETTGKNAKNFVFSQPNASSIILETIDYNKWISRN